MTRTRTTHRGSGPIVIARASPSSVNDPEIVAMGTTLPLLPDGYSVTLATEKQHDSSRKYFCRHQA